jgi:glycine oxidase
LGAQLEAREHPSLLPLLVRARGEYRAWVEKLRAATGIDVGYRVSGAIRVARDEESAADVAREVAWHQEHGLRAERVDAQGAREVEPELGDAIVAGAYFPDESQVDPPALLRALVAATARRSALGASAGRVVTRAGTTVQRLIVEHDRCVGARLDEGEERGDAVVLAAGSWSSLLPGVPSDVPQVRPARGQMVLLDERPPRVRVIVFGKGAYVVPRVDGRVLCGSTLEMVGYRREVTAGGVHAILSGALGMLPRLAEAPLTSTWSNFRPYVGGEHGPLMGKSPLPGLFLATGHHRNGILLAKATADVVADAVLGG